LFLQVEHPDAQPWLEQAIDVELQAGDVLLFHAALFHAANNNVTDQVKFSLVYSYHGEGNHPLPNSKSTQFEEVCL